MYFVCVCVVVVIKIYNQLISYISSSKLFYFVFSFAARSIAKIAGIKCRLQVCVQSAVAYRNCQGCQIDFLQWFMVGSLIKWLCVFVVVLCCCCCGNAVSWQLCTELVCPMYMYIIYRCCRDTKQKEAQQQQLAAFRCIYGQQFVKKIAYFSHCSSGQVQFKNTERCRYFLNLCFKKNYVR